MASVPKYRTTSFGSAQNAATLAKNEAPLAPQRSVLRAGAAALEHAHRYPSDSALRESLARSLGTSTERLVVTNGADELAYLIGAVLLGEGDEAVLGDPGFPVHDLVTRLNGARPVRVPLVDGRHDLDACVRACSTARVAWLPNPHNPTGAAVDPAALARFAEGVPPSCVVVLDEAYAGFMDPALRPDARRLVESHPNVLIARSFSKDAALAGLRLGYGWGDERLVALLRAARPPFSPNAVALAAGQAAVDDPEAVGEVVGLVREERALLQALLDELEVDYWPSQANFVTLDAGARAARVGSALAEAGVAVRDCADFALPGMLRVTIGAPDQMWLVRDTLREALA